MFFLLFIEKCILDEVILNNALIAVWIGSSLFLIIKSIFGEWGAELNPEINTDLGRLDELAILEKGLRLIYVQYPDDFNKFINRLLSILKKSLDVKDS